MRIRLIRKFAESLDGIDLSRCCVGDIMDLPQREAETLIVEGWALPTESRSGSAVAYQAADARQRSREERPARKKHRA